jgi:hypothetical protein
MTITIQDNKVYGYESYFEKEVVVGTINPTMKEVRPAHGYFMPHPFGKCLNRLAKKLNFTFNNN